jgi:hypothetical protein
LIVDGTTPFITNPNLTNPVDQDLNISFNSSEQLESATVELTRSSTTVETYTKSDLDTQTVDGSYQYNTTYTGSSDGDYTVEITKAEDAVGNDAAGNQTEGLSDSVTVETTPVEITSVEAEVGSNTVKVTFNESVVNSTDEGLSPEDLSYTNESGDGAGTITAIDHTAESDTATVTLDAAVSRTGLGNDTIAPVDGRVTDRFDNPALPDAVKLRDTIKPAAPTDLTAERINATTAGAYNLTVQLESDHEAGTVKVDLSNGGTVTASQYVDAGGSTDVVFENLDVSGLSDGDVPVDASLTDDGDNTAISGIGTIQKDTNPPGVSDAGITNASIGTFDAGVEQTVTVNFNDSMDTTVDPNVTIEGTNLNRSYNVTKQSFTGSTWTGTVTIVDDNEQATARINVSEAADSFGNVMTADDSNSFEVDTRGPPKPESTTATNISLANGNVNDYAVTVGLVDESAEKVQVKLEDENGNIVTKNETVGSTTVTVSGIDTELLAEGEISVTARAFVGEYDNSEGFTAETLVTKDTIQPNVSVVSVPTLIDDSQTGTNQSVTVEFDEPMNQSVDLNVTIEGLNRSYDVSGSFDSGTEWTGTFRPIDNNEEATATVSVDEGQDKLGNSMTENTSTTFEVDTVTPTITDFNASHTGNQDINVSFNASQPLSTVDVSFTNSPENPTLSLSDFDSESVDGVEVYTATESVGSDGDYTATLQTAADGAGNDGAASETDSVTVDTTAPTFSGFDPAVGSITADNESTINLTITDTTTSVDNESLDITVTDADGTVVQNATDSDAGVSYTGTTLSLDPAALTADGTFADGDVEVIVIATDTEANQNTISYNVTVDTVAPAVTVEDPDGDDLFRGGEIVAINWTATDVVDVATDSITIEYTTGGSNWETVESATANDDPYSWTVPNEDSETVRVRINATDTAGNVGSNTSETFTVDSTSPTISDFSAANPTGQMLTVSFNASEQLGSVAVDIPNASTTLSLSDLTETDSGSNYEYNATVTVNADGIYEPTLTSAVDLAGNDGAGSESASVSVDTTPPALSNLSVTNPTAQELSISFDTDESVSTAEINVSGAVNETLDRSDFTETASQNGLFSYDRTTTSNTDGTYTVTAVTVADGAGNDGASNESVTNTIDTTAPTISNVSVTNPTGRQVRLAFESSESLSSATVAISGAENATLVVSNPTAVGGVYEIEYTGSTDGSYTATLTAATDDAENDGASDETGSVAVSVDDPVISNTDVSNPSGQTVDIAFDSSTVLSTLNVTISGPRVGHTQRVELQPVGEPVHRELRRRNRRQLHGESHRGSRHQR